MMVVATPNGKSKNTNNTVWVLSTIKCNNMWTFVYNYTYPIYTNFVLLNLVVLTALFPIVFVLWILVLEFSSSQFGSTFVDDC